MRETLADFFRENLWAKLRLLDAGASLNEEQWGQTVPETFRRSRRPPATVASTHPTCRGGSNVIQSGVLEAIAAEG
jgi:hypothetical protein